MGVPKDEATVEMVVTKQIKGLWNPKEDVALHKVVEKYWSWN